ncbi:MAG: transcriptional regulator NrdR [Methanobacteriota archaeon]
MRCPSCRSPDTRVLDSRTARDEREVRRRRACEACGNRFTTFERVEVVRLRVAKRNGTTEDFDREKILRGVRTAAEKRGIPAARLERLADEVFEELTAAGRPDVPTSVVGDLVLEKLKRLDRVAYLRFASVYRGFTDVKAFEAELAALEKEESA